MIWCVVVVIVVGGENPSKTFKDTVSGSFSMACTLIVHSTYLGASRLIPNNCFLLCSSRYEKQSLIGPLSIFYAYIHAEVVLFHGFRTCVHFARLNREDAETSDHHILRTETPLHCISFLPRHSFFL